MATITERVAAGAAFLDQHDPDWWRADVERAISLDKLDLADTEDCVLGQRCPVETLLTAEDEADGATRYHAMAAHLIGIQAWEGGLIDGWAIPLGFQQARFTEREDFAVLTAEWRRVITERRGA